MHGDSREHAALSAEACRPGGTWRKNIPERGGAGAEAGSLEFGRPSEQKDKQENMCGVYF